MNDVIIEKVNGGLGRRSPNGDMISGLLANGVAVVGGLQLNTVYRLRSVKDAEVLLITNAYDTANSVLVHEHINEFFRVNPSGDLYIMLVAQTVSYADMLNPSNNYATKLLNEASGDIRQLAVAYNPAIAVANFTETNAAIIKAQALADVSYTEHKPISVLLEGKGFDVNNPVDFRSLNSKNVSVMVGQSKAVATTHPTYAAIGTLLGAVSKASVNENIGWISKFNMFGGSAIVGSISNTPLNSISTGVKETLNDNGVIFFRTHIGRAGLYFNDSHTCTAITSDFAYIENNRTIDKAVRNIRAVLLPRLNSSVLVDSEGKLSPEVVKSYEVAGFVALEQMQKSEEISTFNVFVDPEQNILSTSELQVQFELTPTGTARKIKATVGFVNPF